MKKILLSLVGLIVIALIGACIYLWTPSGPKLDTEAARTAAAKYDARIVRDNYGTAHIFGKTDADAHFGFAYAHAEDAWEVMEETIMAGRGMSSQYRGQADAPADYLFDLFRVEQSVAAGDLGVWDPEARPITYAPPIMVALSRRHIGKTTSIAGRPCCL